MDSILLKLIIYTLNVDGKDLKHLTYFESTNNFTNCTKMAGRSSPSTTPQNSPDLNRSVSFRIQRTSSSGETTAMASGSAAARTENPLVATPGAVGGSNWMPPPDYTVTQLSSTEVLINIVRYRYQTYKQTLA